MTLYALGSVEPQIHPDAFVHPDAVIIGNVEIGAMASVWPCAVLRGDYGRIVVGARTSVQDGTVVHTTEEWPTLIGEGSVIGHNAHLEGCTIGAGCLVGSGSIVLNRAVVADFAGVGAAALVSEGTVVPTGHIALGVPARSRPAPDLAAWVEFGVAEYLKAIEMYRGLRRID
ncbi:MAG: gamma carbonic anhydrase family protein [Geodermatophilaceae bacterium]|nr:gamma carbonic anhydrase family protein [Geodermatophilaceae bacterium]